MMLWVSLPLREHLLLVFLAGMTASTALEYITGWCMEQLFRVRYWDYSSQAFNLHGYICLSSSIAWGVLTLLLTEVIHKPVEFWIVNTSQALLYSGFCLYPYFSSLIPYNQYRLPSIWQRYWIP